MTPDEAAALRAPFPESAIGKLPKPTKRDAQKGSCNVCGGWHGLPAVHLDYVGHAAATDRILSVDPEWSWEPMALAADGAPLIRNVNGEAELWINLTILGVTKPGVGTASAGSVELSKQLISDAIRNAGMRFGIALDLWAKEDLHDIQSPPADPPPPASTQQRDRVAARIAELTEAESLTLKAWWRTEVPAKAEHLNHDQAEAVLAKLDEIAPESF